MQTCVPVRFEEEGPRHHLATFKTPPPLDAAVVVATRKGPRLARVRGTPRPGQPEVEILRLASDEDLEKAERLKARGAEAYWRLKAFIKKQFPKVKPVRVSYTLDGKIAFFYYKAERRTPFGKAMGELARLVGARVETVHLGPRDEVALLGAIGACGLETCCSTWLQSFGPSTIRMARDQQLPLSPEKISGPCGRLLCCIAYEHPIYKELLAGMPKKNARVCTRDGICGKVAKHFPLKGEVEIKTPTGGLVTARVDELVPDTEGGSA